MSAGTAIDLDLLSWGDLDRRWKPVGETPEEKQRHLQRIARTWGLKAMRGTRGATARFHPMDVVDAEARAAGRRGAVSMGDGEKRSGGEEETGTIVCREPWYAELSPGALTPADMARACGLWQSFFVHVCSICKQADSYVPVFVELDRGNVGLVTRAVCETCLPGHFEKHMREQAAVDALVEAEPHEELTDQRLLTSSPTDERRAA